MAKQQRARRTRRAIIDSAASLFERDGYAGTGIDGIATAAGMTKGAVYFHFPTKRDIATAVLAECDSSVEGIISMLSACDLPPLQVLIDASHVLTHRICHDVCTRASITLCLERGTPLPAVPTGPMTWPDDIRKLLRQAAERREFREGVTVEAATALVLSAGAGVELLTSLRGRRLSPHMVTAMWRLLLPGLIPTNACRRLRAEGSPSVLYCLQTLPLASGTVS
ncbi:ScbR family autoregulator-binding transcription factor [Streptomyces ficellus]|uniref:ScbR family autoregulator-binding transcription factor n=1 Tax=Streptomyces ficellus TaxID=1977088 RepID=A0ABT7ZC24_9ACTN|nr:ScbR family autoregulator-binding transcription factor [Streptomyces ficellus]MDN3297059.1 ScbR family autoregulator-binding transcription factor [Streptomyces ficellus]